MTSYIRPPSHHVTNDCYKKMNYYYKEKKQAAGNAEVHCIPRINKGIYINQFGFIIKLHRNEQIVPQFL